MILTERSEVRDQSGLRLRIREMRARFGYPRIHVMLRRDAEGEPSGPGYLMAYAKRSRLRLREQ